MHLSTTQIAIVCQVSNNCMAMLSLNSHVKGDNGHHIPWFILLLYFVCMQLKVYFVATIIVFIAIFLILLQINNTIISFSLTIPTYMDNSRTPSNLGAVSNIEAYRGKLASITN